MKISELTDEYIAEYLRAEYEGENKHFQLFIRRPFST